MIGNKPSIYNAQSVYNQGGGGSFDVVVNDNKQTLFFPTYLTPVEYIDSSTELNHFNLVSSRQYEIQNNVTYKCVIEGDLTKTNKTIFRFAAAKGYTGSNAYIECLLSGTSNYIKFNVNNQNPWVNCTNFSGIIFIEYRGTTRTLIVKDSNGHIASDTDTHTINNGVKLAPFGVFSGPELGNSNDYFKGKFYRAFAVKENELLFYLQPCKNKDTNEAYIVELVTGSIGKNNTDNFTPSPSFGPEIDLTQIQNYLDL